MNLFDMLGSGPMVNGGVDPAMLTDWMHAHNSKRATAATSALANRAVLSTPPAASPTPSMAQPNAPVGSDAALAGFSPEIVRALMAARMRMMQQQQPQPGAPAPGSAPPFFPMFGPR